MKNIDFISDNLRKYTVKDISPEIYRGSGDEWDSIIGNADIPSSHYNWSNIDYQKVYFEEKFSYKNLPIIFYTKGKPLAIFPIAILSQHNEHKIVSNGGPIYQPLAVKSVTDKEEKTLIQICKNIISSISDYLNIKLSEYQVITSSKGLSVWNAELIQAGRVVRVGQQFNVALSNKTLEQIKNSFRKSYRPLINKGLKKWNIDVVEEGKPEVLWEYKNLHVSVAGRETRSIESWQKQVTMLNRGEAFLVTLRNDNSELIGAGLFVYNTQHCFYSSAAYRRDLFAEPLGHVVQYKAIELMLSKGLKSYEIGTGFSEYYGATPKECSIAKFKSGFCNEIGVMIHIIK